MMLYWRSVRIHLLHRCCIITL